MVETRISYEGLLHILHMVAVIPAMMGLYGDGEANERLMLMAG